MPIKFFHVVSDGFNVIIKAAELGSNGGCNRVCVNVTLPDDYIEEKWSGGVDSITVIDLDTVLVFPNNNLALCLYQNRVHEGTLNHT